MVKLLLENKHGEKDGSGQPVKKAEVNERTWFVYLLSRKQERLLFACSNHAGVRKQLLCILLRTVAMQKLPRNS